MVDADPNDHELTRWLERGDSLADVVSRCRDDEERMRALDRYLSQRSVVDPEELIERVEVVVRGALPDLYDDPRVHQIIHDRRAEAMGRRKSDNPRRAQVRLDGAGFGPVMADGDGRYRVLGLIETGGQGSVYRCVDRRFAGSDRAVVAVKVFEAGRATGEGVRARSVEHPNVVRVYDDGVDERTGYGYIVQEYIDGVRLDRWLADYAPKTRRVVELLITLCEGVEACHRASIVHRDLKPANVLMVGDRPVIVDFGISVAGLDDRMPGGTRAFVAPEILAGGGGDTRVDVYGLGVLMQLMLTGTLPGLIAGGSDIGIKSRSLRSILDRSVARRPTERYGSVGALAADLRAHLNHSPVSAFPGTVFDRAVNAARRSWVLVLVGVLIVAGVAGSMGGVIRSQGAQIAMDRDERMGLIDERAALSEQIEGLEKTVTNHEYVHRIYRGTMQSSVLDLRLRRESDIPEPGMYASIIELMGEDDPDKWGFNVLVRAEGTAMLRDAVASLSLDPSVSRVTAGYWWVLLARVEAVTSGSQRVMVERAYRRARGAFLSVLDETDPIVVALDAEIAGLED